MKYIPFTISDNSITVIFNGKNHVVNRANGCYDSILLAIKNKKWNKIPDLVDKSVQINKKSNGKFTVSNGKIVIKNKEIPEIISKKILLYNNSNLPFEPIIKFWERLEKNPSFIARRDLFGFLESNGNPLTEDGCFICYKGVRSDYKDKWSGKIDNSPGKAPRMKRKDVCNDPAIPCAPGLHGASLSYATSYAGSEKLIYIKVDPKDVVSVPKDHNHEKIRVCKYTVLGDFVNKCNEDEVYNDKAEKIHYETETESDEDDDWYTFDGDGDNIKTENTNLNGSKPYASGVNAGYSDQKGHKRKFFTLPDMKYIGKTKSAKSEFDIGYEDGWIKGKKERRGKHK